MAGARAAAAAASAGSSASSGNQQPQEPGLGELLEEFSRTQYRAKDGSGTGGSKCWDLVQQTQNYLKLLLSLVNSDDDSGLLVHCISGWDRTPLFISLLRLSLWADGLIHTSLKPAEILYLTVAYDWFLFGHMLVDRLSKGEEIFFFCFNFLKHITSEEFSALKTQRRKSLPARDGGFTLEDICMLRRKDRGSTTSLGSDFSLVMESSPGATGSFTYEAVELVPAGAPTQAAWLAALSDRETRLQEVRSAFLAAYSSTVGLRAVAPSPSGAIGGLLEQFARGVGLRGISSNAL
ncbi:MTMR14 isoform 6 [Pongo abelii]|uniref:MTMR14 isoform 6 n=1 Tax=Pongo abelii TaxID=9601 RepID=A0A2J8WDU6_PONAB|nr:MTMR14 isoform 6 [Pongo abelii]